MIVFLIQRTVGVVLSLAAISLVLFLVLNVLPGKASTAALGQNPSLEATAAFNARYGLDRPLYSQYLMWISGAVRGDFGRSYQSELPISGEVAKRFPVTLELTIFAALVALFVSFPLALVASLRPGGVVDLTATTAALVGLSLPSFVTGTALVLIFSVNLHWLPPGGYVSLFIDPGRNLELMLLPALSLGLVSGGLLMRMFRAGITDALGREYILVSRSRGASRARVLVHHALRVAMISFMTVSAMEIGAIFGGAVVVEHIFQLPGIGSLVLQAIQARDYRQLQAGAMVIATVVMIANLLVDVLAAMIDPRLRLRTAQ
jgi:peptide/nickel transport system permease protein